MARTILTQGRPSDRQFEQGHRPIPIEDHFPMSDGNTSLRRAGWDNVPDSEEECQGLLDDERENGQTQCAVDRKRFFQHGVGIADSGDHLTFMTPLAVFDVR